MNLVFKALLVAILFANCLDDVDSCCRRRRRRRRCELRHGGWGAWRPVDSNCNSGLRRWYRHCDNPCPNKCGRGCTGSSEKWEDCNECSSGYHSCDHKCHNTYGSYYCSCNSGYRLEGRHRCKRMTCSTSNWKEPSNGQMTSYVCNNGNVVNYGQVCAVRCNYGYELDPSLPSRSTCGSHGNWSPSSRARCKAKTCRQIYLPSKMTVSPIQCLRSPVHGQVCHLKCLEDFTLEGSATSTCEDGSWTKNNFRCKDKEPPTFNRGCPDNINTKADEGKTTATITWEQPLVSDNDGQRPYLVFSPAVNLPYPYQEGRHFITYIARDRAWNSRSCSFHINVTVLRCQQFTVPENGRLVGSSCNNIYGSVCTVDCNHGYKLVGSGSRKCVKTNNTVKWNGQSAHCESM